MSTFIKFHFKGNAIYHNIEYIVSFGAGAGNKKGYTVIETVNDSNGEYHLVDESPEEIEIRLKELANV